jgi:hypothetical protein
MDNVDVTLVRALRIWWSFCWRAMVLSFLMLFPLEAIAMFFVFSHMPPPGQKMSPQDAMRMSSTMMVVWPFMMAAIVGTQVVAMRWMLRSARWADFRLALLPPEPR